MDGKTDYEKKKAARSELDKYAHYYPTIERITAAAQDAERLLQGGDLEADDLILKLMDGGHDYSSACCAIRRLQTLGVTADYELPMERQRAGRMNYAVGLAEQPPPADYDPVNAERDRWLYEKWEHERPVQKGCETQVVDTNEPQEEVHPP